MNMRNSNGTEFSAYAKNPGFLELESAKALIGIRLAAEDIARQLQAQNEQLQFIGQLLAIQENQTGQ